MSLRSCCCALWIFSVASTLALAQNIAAYQRQQVPDFKGRTLQQVRAAAVVPGTKRALFAAIDSQGPANGVVTAQTPAPGASVIPGDVPLHLTLGNPPPGILQAILQAFANAPKNTVQVPPVTGQNRTVASRTLEAAHLRPSFTGDLNDQAALVAQQSPAAGTSVPQGSAVTLTLTLPQTTVPLVVGKSLADASGLLTAASLRIGTVSGGTDTTTATVVATQTPPAGTQVDPGTNVDLTLTVPAVPPPVPQVSVPDLGKLTPSQASAVLAKVGLQLGTVTGPKGRIGSQQPVPGTQVPPGTAVDVTLAAPPVPKPKPTPATDTPDHRSPNHPFPPTWVIVLASAGGLVVAFAGTNAIVHHFMQPPSTAYSLLTAQQTPKVVIHNQPLLDWQLTVRDGRPIAHSIVDREPAVTRRRGL